MFKIDKKSSNENLDNTSKILNQVSFFSNSHLDAEEINDIDEIDENLNDESHKKKNIGDSLNGDEDEEDEEHEENGEDDDHKQDVNLISEIYQKFMFKNAEKILPAHNVEKGVDLVQSDDTYEEKEVELDDDNDEDDVSQGIYSQWSKQFNSKNDICKKENNKFSKSFEVKYLKFKLRKSGFCPISINVKKINKNLFL